MLLRNAVGAAAAAGGPSSGTMNMAYTTIPLQSHRNATVRAPSLVELSKDCVSRDGSIRENLKYMCLRVSTHNQHTTLGSPFPLPLPRLLLLNGH